MTTFVELVNSRESNGNKRTLRYILMGTADGATARALAISSSATTYDGQARQTDQIGVDSVVVDSVSGTGAWLCTIPYGPRIVPEAGSQSYSFDTSGGTQHITQSRETTATPPGGGTAPNFKGAIEVSKSGVAGVDVPAPRYEFTVTRRIAIGSWTAAYEASLYALTGKSNAASFSVTMRGGTRTFAAGEVCFLGASGSESSGNEWIDVTYKFTASPNLTNIDIGGVITVTSKLGQEHLWVNYAEKKVGDYIVYNPVAAYVARIIPSGNFSVLGVV